MTVLRELNPLNQVNITGGDDKPRSCQGERGYQVMKILSPTLHSLSRRVDAPSADCFFIRDSEFQTWCHARRTCRSWADGLAACLETIYVHPTSTPPVNWTKSFSNAKTVYVTGEVGSQPVRDAKNLLHAVLKAPTDLDVASVSQSTSLVELDLIGRRAEKAPGIMTQLGFPPVLDAMISRASVASLARLTQLRTLRFMCQDNILGEDLRSLTCLTGIEELFIHDCANLSPRAVIEWVRVVCPQTITRLILTNFCNITKKDVDVRRNMLPNLTSLSVIDSKISLGALQSIIQGAPYLRDLNLLRSAGVSSKGLRWVARERHGLQTVTLGGEGRVDCTCVSAIALLHGLTKLQLCDNMNVSLSAFVRLACLTALQRLSLRGTAVDDAAVIAILRDMPHMQELDLSYCPEITNSLLLSLAPSLTKLDLSHCIIINDRGLATLACSTLHLVSLNVLNTSVSEAGLAFLSWMTSLEKLTVSRMIRPTSGHCRAKSNISFSTLMNLQMQSPDLVINAV
jgi:hypothetical protein